MSEDCHDSNNVAAELDSAGDALAQIAFIQFSDDEIFREANRRRGIHPGPRLPSPGCHCQPGRCMAPKIVGTQTPCRDPEKANRPSIDHEAQVPEFEYSDCTQEDAVYGEKFASDVIKLGYNGDIRDAISVTRAVLHRYKRQLREAIAQNATLSAQAEASKTAIARSTDDVCPALIAVVEFGTPTIHLEAK
jgi:hypothetical protein